jgi:sn-glycerol 3-phosphate transport system substrate-binding protein
MKVSKIIMGSVLLIFTLFQLTTLAKPIEIHWWHAMRSARGKVADTMIKAFNDSQSDYKVVGSYKGNYDETVNAGVAAYRAKKQPHLLQSFEVGTQTMMLSGAIYPVYQLMKDMGYNINWKDYLQPVLSYYMNADGNLMSMPFNSSTPVMYYNVDLFKKAGIAPLSKEKPISWDELGEITAKLKSASDDEIDKLRGLLRIGIQWDTEVTIAQTKQSHTYAR